MKHAFSVGSTPLIPHEYGKWIKCEECNPFRTHKDRRSARALRKGLREKVDRFALITAGNAGNSLARMVEGTGMRVTCLVGETLDPFIRRHLQDAGADVREIDLRKPLTSQEICEAARTHRKEKVLDVTNGHENAYRTLADEIQHFRPGSVVCPVGSGELFVGLGKANIGAQLWGVTVESEQSIADKLHALWTPYQDRIRRMVEQGHRLITLSEDHVRMGMESVPSGIPAEPSAAVVYAILEIYRFELGNRTILINTGKGLIPDRKRL